MAKLELRPGGTFLYSMQTPDGHTMWGKWVYREIVAPEKLVTVVSFTDPDGTPVLHPMAATWPLEVLGTMTLAAQGNKTLLTSRSVPINASQVERDTFKAGFRIRRRASMERGTSLPNTWPDSRLRAMAVSWERGCPAPEAVITHHGKREHHEDRSVDCTHSVGLDVFCVWTEWFFSLYSHETQ